MIKIKYPSTKTSVERIQLYHKLNIWFNTSGYVYEKDYRYEWLDTGMLTPDYIWCYPDLALILKLKYLTNQCN